MVALTHLIRVECGTVTACPNRQNVLPAASPRKRQSRLGSDNLHSLKKVRLNERERYVETIVRENRRPVLWVVALYGL